MKNENFKIDNVTLKIKLTDVKKVNVNLGWKSSFKTILKLELKLSLKIKP